MKLKLILLPLAALLAFDRSASADPDPNFHIYLCFGQSNMESGGKMEGQDRTVDKRFQVMADADSTMAELPNSHVVSSAGCACSPGRLHFTAAGSRELGKRYGEKMLSVQGYQKGETK